MADRAEPVGNSFQNRNNQGTVSALARPMNQMDEDRIRELINEIPIEVRAARDVYAPTLSPLEFVIFAKSAESMGLSIVDGEIISFKGKGKNDKATFSPTSKGVRRKAAESGMLTRVDGPFWRGKDGAWEEFWIEDEPPAVARFDVWTIRSEHPVRGIATWKEWAQYHDEWKNGADGQGYKTGERILNANWEQRPSYMLGIKAEVNAYRRANLIPAHWHLSADEDDYDPRQAKVGAMGHLHGVAKMRGLDHDGARSVLKAIRPGIESMTDETVTSRDLIAAADYIEAVAEDALRDVVETESLSEPVPFITEVNGRSVDTTTGEIIEARPAVESQRQALRKLGLKLKISSNELEALCGDLDQLSFDDAAAWIKFLPTATTAECRERIGEKVQTDVAEPTDDGDGGFADFDPYDHGTPDMFGDTAEADTARRRAKAEALTS